MFGVTMFLPGHVTEYLALLIMQLSPYPGQNKLFSLIAFIFRTKTFLNNSWFGENRAMANKLWQMLSHGLQQLCEPIWAQL